MKKFSIIVPAYNVSEYITKAFETIQDQTYKEFEVICVDDCSTDDTFSKIKPFVKKDSRFKLIQHKKNKGPASARNTALNAATGYYIVFIDPDDYIVPNALEKIYKTFEKSGVDSVWYDARVLTGDRLESYANTELTSDGIYDVTPENIINLGHFVWNKAYKRSKIEKYNFRFPEGTSFEDAEFCFMVHTKIKKIYFLTDFLYVYRWRENSIIRESFKGNIKESDAFKIIRNLYKYLKENKLFEKYKYSLLGLLGISMHFYCYPEKYENVIYESLKTLKDINFPEDYKTTK